MLQTSKAFSSFWVNKSEKAREFYDKLGVETTTVKGMEDYGLFEIHIPDGNSVMVYPKENHQPATFTVLNFPVDDIDKTVDELTKKGIVFEKYDDEMIKTDENSKDYFKQTLIL